MKKTLVWTFLTFALGFGVTDAEAVSLNYGTMGQFALLSLNDGSMIIDSGITIQGDVGISAGTAPTEYNLKKAPDAAKGGFFTGTTYIQGAATGTISDKDYLPSGGVVKGGVADAVVSQANADANALESALAGLNWAGATALNGSLNQNLTGSGGVNLFDVTWAYNSNTLTLNGGANDWFIFRSTGGNSWAGSQTFLNGVDLNHVIFWFTTTGDAIDLYKETNLFQGTIFAPDGGVLYHNPATFNGRIIARDINVHSDFRIFNTEPPPPSAVPLPPSVVLVGTGLLGAVLVQRRRSR